MSLPVKLLGIVAGLSFALGSATAIAGVLFGLREMVSRGETTAYFWTGILGFLAFAAVAGLEKRIISLEKTFSRQAEDARDS